MSYSNKFFHIFLMSSRSLIDRAIKYVAFWSFWWNVCFTVRFKIYATKDHFQCLAVLVFFSFWRSCSSMQIPIWSRYFRAYIRISHQFCSLSCLPPASLIGRLRSRRMWWLDAKIIIPQVVRKPVEEIPLPTQSALWCVEYKASGESACANVFWNTEHRANKSAKIGRGRIFARKQKER